MPPLTVRATTPPSAVAPLPDPADGALAVEPPTLAPREPAVTVSVLVPVRDEEQHIERSVATMLAQDVEGEVELLLIDGRSTDRTPEILRALQDRDPRIRVLDNPDRTTAHALNRGLRAARGRFVARMDAHAEYPRSYLRHGIERLSAGDVAWVAGPQLPTGAGRWSSLVARALAGPLGRGSSNKWQAAGAAAPEEWELSTSVFTGVWYRDRLDALGGWDGAWPVNQDSEMAARVLAEGGRIVCRAEMAARYVPRDSPTRLARQYWRYGQYRARTFLRHPSSCGPVRLAAPLLPVGLASAALPGRPGLPGRALAAGYAAALAVQVRRLRPPLRDAPALGTVLATMHLAWGSGFVAALVRWLPTRRQLRSARPAPLRRPSRDPARP